MFDELFFFTYIIAGFVGFLAILLAALLIKHWSSGNKQLLAAIRNFMICTALIDALYFYFNYTFLKTGVYTTEPLPRVLDSFTFIGQVYFWSAYIREKCRLAREQRMRMFLVTLCLCCFCLVTNLASYGFFMDDYYFAPPGPLRTLSMLIEILLMLCLTFITVWHLMKGLSELVQKKIRLLVTIISVLISINAAWNSLLALLFMTGTVAPPADLALDPTGFLLLLVNLFTVLLIYQEDFFALFHMEESAPGSEAVMGEAGGIEEAIALEGASEHVRECADENRIAELPQGKPENAAGNLSANSPPESPGPLESPGSSRSLEGPDRAGRPASPKSSDSLASPTNPKRPEIPMFLEAQELRIKARLDFIAQSHGLTQREREVLELAYEGMTNPEIGEELIISKYTVKRHMHNIFEKLDISTRMELVHLVSGEFGPGGPL